MIVLGHGARRMTAAELRIEVDEAEKRLRARWKRGTRASATAMSTAR